MSEVYSLFPKELLDELANSAQRDCPKPKRYALYKMTPKWLANPNHPEGGTTALEMNVVREANQRPAVLIHRAAYLQSNTVHRHAWYEVRERKSTADMNGEQIAGWRTTEERIWP